MTSLINQPGPSCEKWVEKQPPTAHLTLRTAHFEGGSMLIGGRYPAVNIEKDLENPLGSPRNMIYKWWAFHICVDLLKFTG